MCSVKANVFVSYAHEDDKFRDDLETQLKILKNKGYVEWWSDKKIVPGDEWEKEILDALAAADVILLIISSYFLSSEFCWGVELKSAVKRHNAGTARVIPVFARVCVSDETPIEPLHGVPQKDKPISSWGDKHKAWTEVAVGIQKAVEEWRKDK